MKLSVDSHMLDPANLTDDFPELVDICTSKSCIIRMDTRCWGQDIRDDIWNSISFIHNFMYKTAYSEFIYFF